MSIRQPTNDESDAFAILNVQGDFWSQKSFPTEEAAAKYIVDFWGDQTGRAEECQRTHKIVPVTVKLTLAKEPTP